jgi:glycosyltransferase involved in cell wall biosynthesis
MEIWSIVYERPDNARTGFGRAVWCLSKAFLQKGAYVSIIYENLGSKKITRELVEGIYLYGIPSPGRLLSKRITFYMQTLYFIKKCCNRGDSKVFFLHGPFSLPLAKPLKELGLVAYHTFGTLAYELRRSLVELVKTTNLRKLSIYALDIPIETIYLHHADMIIVPHNMAAQEFKKIYRIKAKKILVSPYGQDMYERFHDEKFFREVEEFKSRFMRKNIILFVGGSDWNRKGARYVLYAFSKLSKNLPVTLIMTGKPVKQYLYLIRELGLKIGEDVILPGLVDDRTLALLYASCDVFTLPSLHEGFSQPVIEVMAYGKPVIVSPLAAYPIVEDGSEGLIINPKNIDSYAYALQKILTDEELYMTMSKNAKLKAQKYSWNAIGSNLFKIFYHYFQNKR